MQSLQAETTESLIGVVRGVLAVRPLIDAMEHPVSVAPVANGNRVVEVAERERNLASLETFLNRVATRVGAPHFKVCSDVQSALQRAVSQRLTGEHPGLVEDGPLADEIGDDIIDEAIAGSFDRKYFRAKVKSFDGALLRTYAAGGRQKKAVLLVSPCGMPAKLCERWIQLLSKDYFVITWESRLLFEDPPNCETFAFDVKAQVSDLFAVMDHFDLTAAHVMGLCGGAVIALSAAAARPERISSMSLWHGDFELGPGCPKTKHQKDLKAFMSAAGMARPQAQQIYKLFSQNTLQNFSGEWAHIVLYPYANAELLYRYGKLNGSIMSTDVTALLAQVAQPTLVVTSRDDGTTHPEGSKRVAALLPAAQLQVIPHGDHLSLFDAAPDVIEIAERFLAQEGC
jgi:3-oxoadipate enol-lactonase